MRDAGIHVPRLAPLVADDVQLGNIIDRQVGDLYERTHRVHRRVHLQRAKPSERREGALRYRPCRRDDHTKIAQPVELADARQCVWLTLDVYATDARGQRRQRGEPSNPGE